MPMYFGADNDSLMFGWFHSPEITAENQSKDVGVVLCSPLGFEEVAAHRGIRSFALDCESLGFPCIRFDYLGCGNSTKDEFSENLVEQWVESIRLAIDTIKLLGKVEQVILVGFRLGFSLAALASVDRTDVLGMVAVSPVVKGREYLRELRLLTSSENQDNADSHGIALAPSGFIISDTTAAEIQKMDLAITELGTKNLLVIEEIQLPPRIDAWSQIAMSNGVNVESVLIDGYLQLSADPQTSQLPRKLFDKIFLCLEDWNNLASKEGGDAKLVTGCRSPEIILTQYRVNSSVPMAEPSKAVKESVVSIPLGAYRLFGILHESAANDSNRTVLFLNAGAVRNIGPNRMFVPLARAWAQAGYRVLRLDFSGIGDSQSRSTGEGNASYSKNVSEELAAAISFLQQHGASEIRLVGLCSGAYHAFRNAVAGAPVYSATMINPLAFDQQDLEDDFDKSYANYEVLDLFANFKRQIRTRNFWSKFRKGQLDTATLRKLVIRRIRFSMNLVANRISRSLNIKHTSDIVQDLREALDRHIAIDFIFSESDPGLELLGRRIGRTFPEFQERENFHIDIIPNADHTFTNIGARSRLVTKLNRLLITDDRVGSSER